MRGRHFCEKGTTVLAGDAVQAALIGTLIC